jgi:hypothetical protein
MIGVLWLEGEVKCKWAPLQVRAAILPHNSHFCFHEVLQTRKGAAPRGGLVSTVIIIIITIIR